MKIWILPATAVFIIVAVLSMRKAADLPVTLVQDSFMEDVAIIHVNADDTDWTAEVRKAVIDSVQNLVEVADIAFTFPRQNLSVTADTGTYNFKTDDLDLQGTVRARAEDMDISLDSVQWNAQDRKLTSDDRTVIMGKSYRIDGSGLSFNEDGTVTIRKNVRARIFYEQQR